MLNKKKHSLEEIADCAKLLLEKVKELADCAKLPLETVKELEDDLLQYE